MNRTPAPESTACAAASIWSGVGEVKTWPGQAASSMPTPDEAGVHRLVAGAAAGDQRDLAGAGRVGAGDEGRRGVDADEVGMGGAEAAKRLRPARRRRG